MFTSLQLWSSYRVIMLTIKTASLKELEFYPEMMMTLIGLGASREKIEAMNKAWVARVLMLATGINDVVDKLKLINHWKLRCLLIREYGKRTNSLDSIIILLNQLFAGVRPEFIGSYAKVETTEAFLIKRANEIAANHHHGLTHLAWLAEKAEDKVGDGTGSRASEAIITHLALPQIGGDLDMARYFAGQFRTKRGKNFFLRVYIQTYGLSDSYQVALSVSSIRSSRYGGKELARKILEIIDTSELEIDSEQIEKLELIAWGGYNNDAESPDFSHIAFAKFLNKLLVRGEVKTRLNNADRNLLTDCWQCKVLPDCNMDRAKVALAIKKHLGDS